MDFPRLLNHNHGMGNDGQAALYDGYQQQVLRLIFLISIPTLAFFAGLNLWHDHLVLGIAEILLDLCFLICLLFFLQDAHLELIRRFLLLSGFVIFTLLFIDGGIKESGLYWGMIFPMLAYPLVGWQRARRLVGLFAAILATLTLAHLFIAPFLPYAPIELFMAAIMLLFFSAMAHIFETHRDREWQRLQQTRDELRRARDHLEQEVRRRTASLEQTAARLREEVAAREKAQRQLAQAQKIEAMSAMVGRLTHDFSNFLGAMMANVYMLERNDKLDDAARARVQLMDKELKQCTEMINQLRMFAHPESGRRDAIPLAAFMRETSALVRMSLPEDVRLDSDIELPADAVLEGDANQLKQALLNLVNNAAHAVRGCAHPRIRLHARLLREAERQSLTTNGLRQADHVLRLVVEDNGPGMSPDVRERVFDPFFTTKPPGEGTGLGLSMVHATIRAHGGDIELDSAQGQGTRVVIHLPLAAARAAEPAQAASEDAPVPGHGETLLLIDDDAFLLQTNAELLRSIGYRVLTAEHGARAIEIAKQQGDRIAAIVSDIVMPDLSGPETIRRLAREGFQRPTLFITGYDQHQQARNLPEALHAPVLRKPVHINTLSRAIARLLAATR